MILDKLQQFDVAGTAASTIVGAGVDSLNTLDLLNARDLVIGSDMDIYVVFTITTSFAATGGASSLRISVKTSPDDATYTVLQVSNDIPKANLTAGTVIKIALSSIQAEPRITALPRYIKCTYTGVTNDFTSGAFECDLVVNPQNNIPPIYPAGVTVSN